ncbi:MAG TPA: DUF4846 domain-containing protein [Bacteroidales bacterium]|nr:DUF4846 domain-containing protein [Bacteroidales bacterium]
MKSFALTFLCFICVTVSAHTQYVKAEAKTISQRFEVPKGYVQLNSDTTSFAYYLQNLPLKPHGTPVRMYDGRTKPNRSVYIGVIDLEIGNANLQQCADAVIRLRAEYLYRQKRYSAVHFNLTNGFNAEYSKWKEGYRIEVTGNKTRWVKTSKPSNDYKTFRKYLDFVFTYAGTRSLSKELTKVNFSNMQIGDVFIQGGSPGHAVIVVNMAENPKTKEKIYLLAQSYMPAQEIQVLQNPSNTNESPWYSLNKNSNAIPTPEWLFYTSDLKSFNIN